MKCFLNHISLLLLFSFMFTYELQAQSNTNATKAETENWILEKLRKYTPNEYTVYTHYDSKYEDSPLMQMATAKSQQIHRNIVYTFDIQGLVVDYEIENVGYGKSKWRDAIPIYDIEGAKNYKGQLCISNSQRTISSYNLTDNSKYRSSSFFTDFEIDSEIDLDKRINKALIYLKKFYKKPVNNELF